VVADGDVDDGLRATGFGLRAVVRISISSAIGAARRKPRPPRSMQKAECPAKPRCLRILHFASCVDYFALNRGGRASWRAIQVPRWMVCLGVRPPNRGSGDTTEMGGRGSSRALLAVHQALLGAKTRSL